jgi:esterase/lipase superfamily enzyme
MPLDQDAFSLIAKISRSVIAAVVATSFVSVNQAYSSPTIDTPLSQQANVNPSNVEVFYITNRLVKRERKLFYTYERSDELNYGTRQVKMATNSHGNKITFQKHANSSHDMTTAEFYKKLTDAQHAYNTKQVIFYVHGYDCNIDVASRVAARLGNEMQLPVVLFSWPSRRNPLTYTADECNAEWSSFQLSEILDDVRTRIGANNITLIGHSMGCRILCWSLQHSKAIGHGTDDKFRHVFLCSPDIDAQVFKKYTQIFEASSDDTRVFASYRDVRLLISKVLHGGIRLGSLDGAKRHAPIAISNDTIQTVDYTDDDPTVFGHAIPYALLKQAIQPEVTVSR